MGWKNITPNIVILWPPSWHPNIAKYLKTPLGGLSKHKRIFVMVDLNAMVATLKGGQTKPMGGTIIEHGHSLRTQEITILGK